jgi:hypothetical protein
LSKTSREKRQFFMKRAAISFIVLFLICSAFGTAANAQIEGGAIAAINEPSEGAGGGTVAVSPPKFSRGVRPSRTKTIKTAPLKAVAARPKPGKWDGFVVGDEYTFMNFEVISAEKPYYTRAARAGGASGLVQVEILIDTNGSVLTARARTGNKLLHPEAERAALASKFSRFTFGGKPARAIGFLVYRFGSEDRARPMSKRYDFESPFKRNNK